MILRIIFCLLVIFLPGTSLAQDLPQPASDHITDLADLLPPEAEARITELLVAGRAETGVHITILTLDSLANHGGEGRRIEDYAKAVFNSWGIGDATRNDGMLILVARDDREVRIALGSGYDAVWDGRAQRVIDTAMLPAFKNNDYAGGLEAGAEAALERIARPFKAGLPRTEDDTPMQFQWPDWLFALMALMVGGGVALRRRIGDLLVSLKACPKCGARSLTRRREQTLAATSTTQGQGVLHTRCAQCGYDEQRPFTIPAKRKSGSRGGGFGGGRSSGGGATGRW